MKCKLIAKRSALLMFAVFALPALPLPKAPTTLNPAKDATPVHEIEMTAKKYEFSADPIRVKKGERVRLTITATDRDHGFKLEAFNIEQKLKKGVPATVEFTADKSGEFPFRCSVHCGLGHGRMKGKLIVEE